MDINELLKEAWEPSIKETLDRADRLHDALDPGWRERAVQEALKRSKLRYRVLRPVRFAKCRLTAVWNVLLHGESESVW